MKLLKVSVCADTLSEVSVGVCTADSELLVKGYKQ